MRGSDNLVLQNDFQLTDDIAAEHHQRVVHRLYDNSGVVRPGRPRFIFAAMHCHGYFPRHIGNGPLDIQDDAAGPVGIEADNFAKQAVVDPVSDH